MSVFEIDTALADMMAAVFAEHGADADLWDRLDALGLVRLTGSEATGGSGAGWPEAAELLSAAVRHAVRVPLAEHDLLACWLLESAGAPVDSRRRTVALLDAQGRATAVPAASSAQRIVVAWQRDGGYRVADVDADQVSITAGANMIGEPRDTVAADTATLTGVTVPDELIDVLHLKAPLVRAVQICAALDSALELSVEHTTTRIQFGRPLAKFQAVQHLVSDIACEAALARSATEAALSVAVASDWTAPNLDFLVAAARSCAGHATSVVVRNAHQVHGAIGTTIEHRLHHLTRAALAWRSEYGTTKQWDDRLTGMAMRAGPQGLWSLISP
ncbi:acyl-CoA dehydrogenase [Mycolicibacterium sp. 018/SC-01/001]|uniref:acyl-CoA dehydrogenase family protein n=1 Tax=Mycolicibacterium sp. 018/SC-01/001 TaxID=2592069 RepID=UPI00117E2983|nr:acyl-CoA dehydrogenase family protein [Mycolicibacterium sp. 018/SC-01/001]TRW88388.1 acyl-CoA dehydrogenase [Mycolicibacterium sp. 018/SC-01/001]